MQAVFPYFTNIEQYVSTWNPFLLARDDIKAGRRSCLLVRCGHLTVRTHTAKYPVSSLADIPYFLRPFDRYMDPETVGARSGSILVLYGRYSADIPAIFRRFSMQHLYTHKHTYRAATALSEWRPAAVVLSQHPAVLAFPSIHRCSAAPDL